MALIIGIVIGFLIGAGLIYLMLNKSLTQKTQELDHAKRTIDELERNRESRLREATEALQRDYQRKLDQQSRDRPTPSDSAKSSPSTKIQSSNQTKIQSDTSIPSGAPDSPPDSTSTTPAPPHVQPSTDAAPTPIAKPTQPEVSFVRSGLTNAQQQDLIRVIFNMGKSKQMSHLPELQRLSVFASSEVREAVAIAIGKVAAAHSDAPAIRQTVPLLGKLSQDPDPVVRLAALEGLGSISSSRVVPYVRRLLRDPDMKVMGAAKTLMDRFKYYRSTPSPSSQKKKKKSYGSKPSA